MAGRRKSKHVCSKVLSQRLKKEILIHQESLICQLPDPLICEILSHLPIKDGVKTSVLSTRWRSLWLWVPRLELDSSIFPDLNTFVGFVNKFLDSSRVSCIDKLKLHLGENARNVDDASYLTSWIEAAVKRKVQHLDVFCPPDGYLLDYEIPISLLISDTLVSLKVHEMLLANAEFVSLPFLKTMDLEYVLYPNEATFERLISCCPLLEDLTISSCENMLPSQVFRVRSMSLKKLDIYLRDCMGGKKYGVVIDAPQLCSLTINDDDSESFIINNLNSDAKLDISLSFGLLDFDEASVSSRRSSIRDFLLRISNVEEMIIYIGTLELFCQYSKLEPLPQFAHMSQLYADIDVPNLKWLLPFLGSCPNLKSLRLIWDCNFKKTHFEEMIQINQISFSYVPECLLSSLESVDIETSISGYAEEMKLIRYFLENSIVLKKLTLRLNVCANENFIFKKLLEIPRRSITCQIVVR